MQSDFILPADTVKPTFDGIVRADGRVATRNYLGVFVVGNCGATVARKIADWFTEARLADFPNVDGVVPFVHEIGCGMEMTGEPMDLLRRTIAGTLRNPNIAGGLVIALGCERNNIYGFMEQEKLVTGPLLKTLVMQELGGTANTIEAGIAEIEQMLPIADDCRREPVSAAYLTVGLQTAGREGTAATHADRALGAAVDLLVAAGGTALLSGTADVVQSGADLAARAASAEVAAALQARVDWWRSYHAGRDTRLKPASTRSAGIAAAGLQRAGHTALEAVTAYAQPVTSHGLVFMDAPAYVAVSATGQVAAGANLICVTTATGTAFGALPTPTLKLADSSALYAKFEDDLDIDCGPVADGAISVEAMGQRIFAEILAHASGKQTRSENLGVGENEFVPWPIGVLA
ncbi:altronate hydrolase [Cupriavidus sp. YR651]|uniref:UxaA family hydrolase n=1 Tax=Cupriavidus sp. YR651 TaxID=1855315 RepID=UPI00088A807E|nr:UxaA family hydrolase [Cupriavidus sp. YR651]SDD01851.1 altronate hydrolase [Cupriavidus sp. YR651]